MGRYRKYQERNAAIIRLYCENNTLQFVADTFGVSRQSVHQLLKKEGVSTRRTPKQKPLKVKNILTSREKFWGKVDKSGGEDACWLWVGKSQVEFGYGKMYFKGKSHYSHHLAWYFTFGKFASFWVLHDCGNAACCNPKHLKDGTPTENAADRYRHGRDNCGQNHPRTTLNNEQVVEIRRLSAQEHLNFSEIARRYSITSTTAANIIRGITWKHVEMQI